jgi:serine/threonine-protein kinase
VLNSASDEDAYLCDGFTDEVIDGLACVQKLRVISRSVVNRWAGRRDVDPFEVGAQLSVDVVVEGSLRRLGAGKLRLSVRVITAKDGVQLWTKRFELGEAQLLEVADEAVTAIARALASEEPEHERRVTDPAAIDLYLRARAAQRAFSPDNSERAIALVDEALRLAPGEPQLISLRAKALAQLAFFRGDKLEEALAAARNAVARAPESAEANLALSFASNQAGQSRDALVYALAAVSHAPSLSDSHQMVGKILAEVGPLELAYRFLSTALDLDPSHGMTRVDCARVAALLGKRQRAEELMTDLAASNLDGASRLIILGRLHMWRGERDRCTEIARTFRERAKELAEAAPQQGLFAGKFAQVFDAGAPPWTAADVATFSSFPTPSIRRDVFFLQLLVESACARGPIEIAEQALERAVAGGLQDHAWLAHCPVLAPLRARDAFAPLAEVVRARAEHVRTALPSSLARSHHGE